MNKRLWIVFAILVIAALAGLILWKQRAEAPPVNIDGLDGTRLLTQEDVGEGQIPDHFVGKKDSKVIVIQYEDFACVHCAQDAPVLGKIMDEYQDRVLFIYRNFSLGYPNSTVTQSAAEAAFLLGGSDAYWKMHGKLFQDETTWTGQAVPSDQRKSLFTSFAKDIGLDVDKFFTEIDNYTTNGIRNKIERDKLLGLDAGATGTPTWFVNGKKVDGVTDENVRKALDEALKNAN